MIKFAIAQHRQEVFIGKNKSYINTGEYLICENDNYKILTPQEFDSLYVVTKLNSDFTGKAQFLKND